MTDDMIRALAKNGGVIMINYHVELPQRGVPRRQREEVRRRRRADGGDVEEVRRQRGVHAMERPSGSITRRWPKGELPKCLLGEDRRAHRSRGEGRRRRSRRPRLGLRRRDDAAGMEDASKLPKITDALLKKGYSDADIRKILGENTLRVMAAVERVSREMQSAP